MDDTRAMRRVERARDLDRECQRLVERHWAFIEAIGERLAFNQFQDQCADAVALFDPVDGADVGMVERREHPRLALEARQAVGIRGEDSRQDFERDVSPELRIARAIHLAHAARSEQCLDLIDADPSPGQHGSAGGGDQSGRRRECGIRQEAHGVALVRQKRCYFLMERVITAASLAQKSGAIARVTL